MISLSYDQIDNRLPLEKCREYAIFGALSDKAIRYLLTEGTLLSLNQKETLFEVGDRSDRFYVVLAGRVSFYKCSAGNWAFMSDYRRGEQIGFVGMMVLQPRVGAAYMEDAGLLLEITADLFHDFQMGFPEDFSVLMINLVREISRNLIQVGDMLVDLTAEKGDRVG